MPRVINPTDKRLKENRPQLTNAMALIARARGAQPQDSVETYVDDDTKTAQVPAMVSRSGYGTAAVFVLTPSGVVKRDVNVQSIAEVLNHPNYAAECQDCGSPSCSGEINGCSGREPRKFRICPVRSCRKHLYDPVPTGQFLSDEFDHSDRDDEGDPNAIDDDVYSVSTPESRTKAAMDLHIIAVHAATAAEMGIGRPAELPRMAVV